MRAPQTLPARYPLFFIARLFARLPVGRNLITVPAFGDITRLIFAFHRRCIERRALGIAIQARRSAFIFGIFHARPRVGGRMITAKTIGNEAIAFVAQQIGDVGIYRFQRHAIVAGRSARINAVGFARRAEPIDVITGRAIDINAIAFDRAYAVAVCAAMRVVRAFDAFAQILAAFEPAQRAMFVFDAFDARAVVTIRRSRRRFA